MGSKIIQSTILNKGSNQVNIPNSRVMMCLAKSDCQRIDLLLILKSDQSHHILNEFIEHLLFCLVVNKKDSRHPDEIL